MKEHKAKIGSAILWFIVYLLGMPISRQLFGFVGITDRDNTIYRIVFVLILFLYMHKKEALSYYGIRSLKELDSKALLYYIPFGLMAIMNLISGVDTALSWEQILLGIVTALCIGFIEEILFRGFLFKALLEKGTTCAIAISSCAFGFVHLINLTGGADIAVTLMQVVGCSAFGFACAVFIYKTKNILPCIITHGLINATDSLVRENANIEIVLYGLWGVISLAYGIYLLKMDKPAASQAE